LTDKDIGPRRTISRRILDLLSREGCPLKIYNMAQILKIKPKVISAIISRIRQSPNPPIVPYYGRDRIPLRGFYQINPEARLTDYMEKIKGAPEIHNCKIYFPEVLVKREDELLRIRPDDLITRILTNAPTAEISGNRRNIYLDLTPARHITFTVANNGSLQIWIKCGTQPYPIPEYSTYLLILSLILGSDIWTASRKEVQQIEFNLDYRGIRISGLSAVTVEQSEGELLQIYQKYDDTLREEKRYWLQGLTPETLAKEFNKIDKKADSYIKTAQINDLHERIRGLETVLHDMRGDLRSISIVALATRPQPTKSITDTPTDRGPPNGYG
jgi:hypothetical protein